MEKMCINEQMDKLKEVIIHTLAENLVCLLHHGSRARGEARPDSDYDLILIVKKISRDIFKTLRDDLYDFPHFTFYLLSLHDLETMHKGQHLQFLHVIPLYGDFEIDLPTKEEVKRYIAHMRTADLHIFRHTLIHPHSPQGRAKLVYYGLKDLYIYLSYLVFCESDQLPLTRKDTIDYFTKKNKYELGVRLLRILDNFDKKKDDVAKDPDHYLLLPEEFFRKSVP